MIDAVSHTVAAAVATNQRQPQPLSSSVYKQIPRLATRGGFNVQSLAMSTALLLTAFGTGVSAYSTKQLVSNAPPAGAFRRSTSATTTTTTISSAATTAVPKQ